MPLHITGLKMCYATENKYMFFLEHMMWLHIADGLFLIESVFYPKPGKPRCTHINGYGSTCRTTTSVFNVPVISLI